MKLIYLFALLISFVLKSCILILVSPFYIPYLIVKWYKNRKWRKSIKIGDECFFINMNNNKTFGTIEFISNDDLKAAVRTKLDFSEGFGWHDIKDLRII